MGGGFYIHLTCPATEFSGAFIDSKSGYLYQPAFLLYDPSMIRAYAYHENGSVETVDTLEAVTAIGSRDDTRIWIDLEDPTEADLHAIGSLYQLDAEALEDCLRGQQRPRIDEFERYIFIVSYGMFGATQESEVDPRKLAAFFGERFLITVHRDPVLTVREVRGRLERNTSQILGRGLDFILYSIIDGMVDKYDMIVGSLEKRLEALEGDSLSADLDDSVLERSADLRRELLELRQITVCQKDLLSPLAGGEYEYISENLGQRFSHVEDHLVRTIELIDVEREILVSVRDNYNSALANRTNDIMRVLTLIATLMMPLTVIAGIYGMNLPLWPRPDHPASFWIVLGAMAGLTVGMLGYFRHKRWI